MAAEFLNKEAVLEAAHAAMAKARAEPGGNDVVPIYRFLLDHLQQTPLRIAKQMADAIGKAHDAHEKRIADLEERLRVAETRKALPYRGVWRPDEQYSAGDLVTDQGSMWCCHESTRARPGESSKDWVLAVKKGRDGRDAR